MVANGVAEVHDIFERRPHVGIGFRPEPVVVIRHHREGGAVARAETGDDLGGFVDGEAFRIEPALLARAHFCSWSSNQLVTRWSHRRAIPEPWNICTPWGAPGSTCSSVCTPHWLRRVA